MSYLVGEELTLADLSVSAMTMYLAPLGLFLERFAAFSNWCRRVESTAEWRATAVEPWKT